MSSSIIRIITNTGRSCQEGPLGGKGNLGGKYQNTKLDIIQSSYEFIAINFSTIYSFCKSLLMEECEK